MNEIVKNLIKEVKKQFNRDLASLESKKILSVIDAYNQWQEECKNCVDYLYCINVAEDLKACIDGGMKATDIAKVVEHGNAYFFFGENHEWVEEVKSKGEKGIGDLGYILAGALDELIPYVLKNPRGKAFEMYQRYVSTLIEND